MQKNNILLKVGPRREISFNTKYGAETYRRSLTILLQCAISELYPELKIQIGQSLMNGYYFGLPSDKKFPSNFVRNITNKMRRIVALDEKFKKIKMDKTEAIKLYKRKKREDKIKAISYLKKKKIELIFLRNYFDFVFAECVSSTKFLSTFKVIRYKHGFILQFPVRGNILKLPTDTDRQEKLYKVHLEAKDWNKILGIRHITDLNHAIRNGTISTLIRIQEAFHEKKIGYVADKIKAFYPQKKLIFVAGPSASGKTTFLKRLSIQLRANGLIPHEIFLDNYFFPREKTPKTPDGEYDFECVEALDIKHFTKQISALMDGREIILPKFSFKSGKRKNNGRRLKLGHNSVILIEGIHGLNPALSNGIDEKNKYNIFVSALTQLCIDNDTRIFTSDSRLMRRIIRDYLFRGYNATDTIKRFPRVRKGEDRYIFPFQDNADIFFNSSIIYEQAVLKPFITKLLKSIKKKEPEYFEARRLLNYLNFFLAISAKEVPQISILREFIGKSGFRY